MLTLRHTNLELAEKAASYEICHSPDLNWLIAALSGGDKYLTDAEFFAQRYGPNHPLARSAFDPDISRGLSL